MAQQNPPQMEDAAFDHAEMGVSVCDNCESPRINVVRVEDGTFELRCGHCEATLMAPFYPPGWEDHLLRGPSGEDEETLAVPSYDDLTVFHSGGHAYIKGDAEAWERLQRAARDQRRDLDGSRPRYDVKCRSVTCEENTLARDLPGEDAREVYDDHDCKDGLKQLVPTN